MASAGAEAVFVDTNVLVHANVAESPLHQLALTQLPQLAARSNEFRFERKAKFLKSFGVSLQTRV